MDLNDLYIYSSFNYAIKGQESFHTYEVNILIFVIYSGTVYKVLIKNKRHWDI
jgi:hypothetical protein|tara:strand:+ start:680 stop:838 length:159 start_codon:yes stop_codon:yes gene_type:complete